MTKINKTQLNSVEEGMKNSINSVQPKSEFVESLEKELLRQSEIYNLSHNKNVENSNKSLFLKILLGTLLLIIFVLIGFSLFINNKSTQEVRITEETENDIATSTNKEYVETDKPFSILNYDSSNWSSATTQLDFGGAYICNNGVCNLEQIKELNNDIYISYLYPENFSYSTEDSSWADTFTSADKTISIKVSKYYNTLAYMTNCSQLDDYAFADGVNNANFIKREDIVTDNLVGQKFIYNYPDLNIYSRSYCLQIRGFTSYSTIQIDSPDYIEGSDLENYYNLIIMTAKLNNVPLSQEYNTPASTYNKYESLIWNYNFEYSSSLDLVKSLESTDGSCEAIRLNNNNQKLLVQVSSGNYHCVYPVESALSDMDMRNLYGIGNVQYTQAIETSEITTSNQVPMTVKFQKILNQDGSVRIFQAKAYNNGIDPMTLGSASDPDLEPDLDIVQYTMYFYNETEMNSWKESFIHTVKTTNIDFTKR